MSDLFEAAFCWTIRIYRIVHLSPFLRLLQLVQQMKPICVWFAQILSNRLGNACSSSYQHLLITCQYLLTIACYFESNYYLFESKIACFWVYLLDTFMKRYVPNYRYPIGTCGFFWRPLNIKEVVESDMSDKGLQIISNNSYLICYVSMGSFFESKGRSKKTVYQVAV